MSAEALTRPGPQLLLCGCAFFGIATEALIGILLPLWALDLRLSPTELGVVVAMGSVAPTLLAMPGGAYCDYFGDREVMIAVAVGVLVTSLFYPFATNVVTLGALQLVAGLFRAFSWMAAQSYAVRSVPDAARVAFMGRFSFAATFGSLLIPVLGGGVMYFWGAAGGFVFLGVWGGMLGVMAFLLPSNRQSGLRNQRSLSDITLRSFRDTWPLLFRPVLLVIMAYTLLRLSSASVTVSFFPVHLKTVGFTAIDIGVLVTFINACSSAGSLLSARLARIFSSRMVLWVAISLSIVGICLTAVFSALIPLAVCGALHGLCLGLSLPLLLNEIARHTAPAERGLVIGLRSVFNRAGYLAVPVALGLITASADLVSAFLLTGGVLVLGVLATTALMYRYVPEETTMPTPGA